MLTVVLLYALVANVVEKPDGIVISGLFILGIVAVSVVSRVRRSASSGCSTISSSERMPAKYCGTNAAVVSG